MPLRLSDRNETHTGPPTYLVLPVVLRRMPQQSIAELQHVLVMHVLLVPQLVQMQKWTIPTIFERCLHSM